MSLRRRLLIVGALVVLSGATTEARAYDVFNQPAPPAGLGGLAPVSIVGERVGDLLVVDGDSDVAGTRPFGVGVGHTGVDFARHDEASLLVTTAGETTVASNLDAGGAVWVWQHRGVDYVNTFDNGRQVQSALWVRGPTGHLAIPTEAGDYFSCSCHPSVLRHGSPTVLAESDGARQRTLAMPLEWLPGVWDAGGGPFRPMAWRDVRLGKDLELEYEGRPGVARYQTVVSVPGPIDAVLEMPTAYLRASFTRIVAVDASRGETSELHPGQGERGGIAWAPSSGRGGLVAATPDGTQAFGLYAVTDVAGGQASGFSVHDFSGFGTGTGPLDYPTVRLLVQRTGSIPAGTSSYEAFVVTGTLDDVVASMRALAG